MLGQQNLIDRSAQSRCFHGLLKTARIVGLHVTMTRLCHRLPVDDESGRHVRSDSYRGAPIVVSRLASALHLVQHSPRAEFSCFFISFILSPGHR